MVWILISVLIGGILLAWVRLAFGGVRRAADLLAVAAYLGFFGEAAHAVVKTLIDNTVFMTQVHEVLLSTIFLVSGAYLGVYGLCLLMTLTWGRSS